VGEGGGKEDSIMRTRAWRKGAEYTKDLIEGVDLKGITHLYEKFYSRIGMFGYNPESVDLEIFHKMDFVHLKK